MEEILLREKNLVLYYIILHFVLTRRILPVKSEISLASVPSWGFRLSDFDSVRHLETILL